MPVENLTADRLRSRLHHGAQQLALPLLDQHVDQLIALVQLIEKWNRVYNLTAVRSMDDMVGRHILDSLSVLQWLPTETQVSAASTSTVTTDVLDVGSGAGLPVLPLAIVRPDLQFLSVESNGKKTRFQQQVVVELGLGNVRIEQQRIEQVTDKVATCLSRAFTAPEKFLEIIKKNCVPESRVIIMLGYKERLPDKLPGEFICTELTEIEIPHSDATRHVAICTAAPSSAAG